MNGPEPRVLELNYSPDISAASPMDKFIKGRLLADTLHLVGVPLPPGVVADAPPEFGLTNRTFDTPAATPAAAAFCCY